MVGQLRREQFKEHKEFLQMRWKAVIAGRVEQWSKSWVSELARCILHVWRNVGERRLAQAQAEAKRRTDALAELKNRNIIAKALTQWDYGTDSRLGRMTFLEWFNTARAQRTERVLSD